MNAHHHSWHADIPERHVRAALAVVLIAGLLTLIPPPPAGAAVETKPLIVALCHGNNQSWPQNLNQAHFEDQFSETAGSETIADYWRDISDGQFSIEGTRVVDVQLDVPRDAIGDRDQNDFGQCRDGLNAQYDIDWDVYAGPVVIKPQTQGRTVSTIDDDDTQVQVRADGPSVMDDWPSAPFTLVLTKTGTLWQDAEVNIENVTVTSVTKDDSTGIATFTIVREQGGYRQSTKPIPSAKAWPANTIVKDISDAYGSRNSTAVVSSHEDPSVTNQELGHFFGFDHSRKLSTATSAYGDCFDVMSTLACTSHYFPVPFAYPGGTYDQWNGPGMTSIFLDLKGWIPASDRAEFAPTDCRQQTYTMRALGVDGSALQQIRVPVSMEIQDGVTSEYLTVELRSQQFHWDQGIPRDAFVLHLKGDDDLSYLVDAFGAGGTNGMKLRDRYVFDARTTETDDDRYFFVNSIDEATGTGQITVASCPITTEVTYTGPTSFTYDTEVGVGATFALTNGVAGPGGPIDFEMGGSTCWANLPLGDPTVIPAEADCDLDIDMVPGTYTLTARWDSTSAAFAPSEDTATVTVARRGTTLQVDTPPETAYHDPVELSATLAELPHADDASPDGSVVGRDVRLEIGDAASVQTCEATTATDGSATCTIDSVEQVPASGIAVTATFSGDDYFTPSSATSSFDVVKRATELIIDAPDFTADGGPVTLTGTLVEDDGGPIDGRLLFLSLGEAPDAQWCVATTNTSGDASCEITNVDQSLGPVSIHGSFAGDPYYLSSSDVDELVVFAWTRGGNFVIGDGSASDGAAVTFWSSEWYLENATSAGRAPDAFKGFADGPSSAQCGTGWTSSGGASANVPDDVPEYTAMLVTGSVVKHGRNISGDTRAIAIVQVEPGFQGAAGHAATATVVGMLCSD